MVNTLDSIKVLRKAVILQKKIVVFATLSREYVVRIWHPKISGLHGFHYASLDLNMPKKTLTPLNIMVFK